MAFSTFRGMMGGSNSVTPPVVLTDTVTPEVHSLVQYQQFFNGAVKFSTNALAATITSTNTNCLVYSYGKGTGITADASWLPVRQGSAGPYLLTGAPVFPNGSATTIDANYGSGQTTATANNGGVNVAQINWINNTNTLGNSKSSSGFTDAVPTIRVAAMGTGTQTATFALQTGGSNLSLFDQSGSQYYNTVSGPTDASKQISMLSLTNSLGVVIYNTSANLIKLFTINVASNLISADSAISSTITATSGAKAVMIDSTHILLIYKKTTNTLGARIVTVATGSTFTFGTEYTATATGITDDPIGTPGQFTGSGDYGVTWINANGQGCCTLIAVSGSSMTLSNPNIYHTANDMYATSDYYSSSFVAAQSSFAIIVYMIQVSSANVSSVNSLVKAVGVRLNYSTSSNPWNATYVGNFQSASIPSGPGGLSTAYWDLDSFGTDRYIGVYNTGSTTITFACTDNDYVIAYNNATNTFTTSGSVTTGNVIVANIGVTGNTARSLVTYSYGTTVETRLVTSTQNGTVSSGSVVSVDTSATSVSQNTLACINFAPDQTLILWPRATGIYASIITSSGSSTPTASSPTLLYSVTTSTNAFMQLTLLSTDMIMFTYCGSTTGAVSSPGIAGIITISGSTVTLNTTVSLGANVSGTISSCQTSAGAGAFYFYDYVSSIGNMYVQGFTYSGTTITLGGSEYNVTQNGSSIAVPQTYKTMALSVQNGDMLMSAATSTGSSKVQLVTRNSINSFTIGSSTALGGSLGNYAFWLPQDCYSKAMLMAGGTRGLYNIYRT